MLSSRVTPCLLVAMQIPIQIYHVDFRHGTVDSYFLMIEKVLLVCILLYIHELHMHKRDQRNIVDDRWL